MPANEHDIVPPLPGATAVGLALPDGLPEEAWWNVGLQLNRLFGMYHWYLADWWNYGEHRYGNRKAIVDSEAWTGPEFQACMDVASVGRAFKTSRRREVLSFTHHRVVASLPRDDADRLLDWCEETIAQTGRPRSSRDLRAKVKEYWRERDRKIFEQQRPIDPPARTVEITIDQAPQELRAPLVIQRQRPEPEIQLDNSGVSGEVPPELAALRLEPPGALDRVEIARSAFAELSVDQQEAFVREASRKLPVDQQIEILADWVPELGFRLIPIAD